MLLSTFMEYALEGYGVVVKNGILERVPCGSSKRVLSHKRKNAPTKEENIQTIVAFIEAVKAKHGVLCSHIATLILVESIQKQEMLSAGHILHTYQNMIEVQDIIKQDFLYFAKLPRAIQKTYMLLMVNTYDTIEKKQKISKNFLFQAMLSPNLLEKSRTVH